MSKLKAIIMTAGHLDIEWYMPMKSYRFWTVEALEQLKIAAQREDFKTYILDGQYYPLKEYLDVMPQDEKLFKKYVADGKLTIGPFFTQFDEWLPSAESMIRNCLYGKRLSQKFGGYMRAGYLPDNFGHPRQLPQILGNFDIDSLMFMRGMPEVAGGHPDEFLYEGLDGSNVLVSHFRESYTGGFDLFDKVPQQLGEPLDGILDCSLGIDGLQPRDIPYYNGYLSFEWHKQLADHTNPLKTAKSFIENTLRIQHRYPSGVVPIIVGFDHLPPQINVGEVVKLANEIQGDIEFVMGTAQQYTETVRARATSPTKYNFELLGSKYQGLLLGALSTRSYLKRQNFAAEALVEHYAEPLETLATLYGYNRKARYLDEAWELLMINASHDSIHGTGVDEVHTEMESRFSAVKQICTGVVHETMKCLGKNIAHDPNAPDKTVIVYSPSSAVQQPVEVWLPLRSRDVVIKDAQGNILPSQVAPRDPIGRNSNDMPRNETFPHAMFQKVTVLGQFDKNAVSSLKAEFVEQAIEVETDLKHGENFIENAHLRVEFKNAVIDILDKNSGEWYRNLNVLEENEDAGDVWDYSPSWLPSEEILSTKSDFTLSFKQTGLVAITAELNGIMNVPRRLNGDVRSAERIDMPVTIGVTLTASVPRVDVKVTIDNTAKDHRVRLAVSTGIQSDFVRSQGHLAILDRPIVKPQEIEPWEQPFTQQLPFREWVAVQGEKRGLAVVTKGIYDYEADINPRTKCVDVRLTLLRGVELMTRINTMQRTNHAAWPFATPGAQCLGMQEFEWSYIPYTPNNEKAAPFIEQANAFMYPAVAHAVRDNVKPDTDATGIAAPFAFDEHNIQLSAFKLSYEGDAYILRFYENQGIKTDCRIALSPMFKQVWLSNMDEACTQQLNVSDCSVTIEVLPYKAITLKMFIK